MNDLNFASPLRSLLALTTALALSACVLPTKLGEVSDTDEPGTGSGTSTAQTGTSGEPDATTTEVTTGPQDSGTTGEPQGCAALDEAQCAADPTCMTRHATPYAFEACPQGQVYLGCMPEMPCDLALLTICRDGSDEVYQLGDGCVPPGFSTCDSAGLELCAADDCSALDELSCANDLDFCEPIYGHKHVLDGDEMCVELTPTYLVCMSLDGACPPFVPTVCSPGQPTERYDIPSGCIPPGYEVCEGGGTPECP